MFTSKVDAIHAKKSAGGFPWINGLSRHYLKVLWPQISVCGLVARNADRVAINVGWLQLMWAELQLMWARAPRCLQLMWSQNRGCLRAEVNLIAGRYK